jgi:hypothetical protein
MLLKQREINIIFIHSINVILSKVSWSLRNKLLIMIDGDLEGPHGSNLQLLHVTVMRFFLRFI